MSIPIRTRSRGRRPSRSRTILTTLSISVSTVLSMTLSITHSASAADDHAHEHEHDEHDAYETIVVTGSPLAHDRDEIAIPVERVSRDELLQNLGSTLGESLSFLPGITTTGFSGGASRPVVRGQDAYRTEVLEDGLRTHDVSRESPDHAVPINPLAVERIEVVRGPGTLRYGGGASAGVINAITNRIPDRMPAEPVSGEVFGGIGLGADARDLAAMLNVAAGPFALHADGILGRANNYAIPNNGNPHTQSGTKIDDFSGSLGGAWIDDRGRLGFSYTRVEDDYGIPAEDEDVEIKMETNRYRFEGDWSDPTDGIREIRARGVYTHYEHDEIADGVNGQTYRNEEFEGRLEVIHEPIFGFFGALGLHGSTRDFRAEGEASEFLAPTDTEMVALYAFEERELIEGLTGELGFRVEHTSVDGRGISGDKRDRDFVPLSAAIGLVANPVSGLSIGLSGAVNQRAPSQVELFARGAHEATQTFEIGDPGLDEETSYAVDFRIAMKGSRGRIEWSSFVTRYEDYIYGAFTGGDVDEDGNPVAPGTPGALQELRYVERNAVFYGTELAGELDAIERDWGVFGVDGQFDFVRARFTNGSDRNLPRIVPIRWGGGVYFRSTPFDARIGFRRTEAQNKVAPFESPSKSFTFLNASLVYRADLIEDWEPIELSIVARNLTDVRGRNHVAFNNQDVLLPGRDIRFGLRVQF